MNVTRKFFIEGSPDILPGETTFSTVEIDDPNGISVGPNTAQKSEGFMRREVTFKEWSELRFERRRRGVIGRYTKVVKKKKTTKE